MAFYEPNQKVDASGSQAAKILVKRMRDGSLGEILQDWRWIWSFSRGHRLAIGLYTLCGIVSSAMGLVSGVVSKYMIDGIVTQDLSALRLLIPLLICSAVFSLAFRSLTARLSAHLSVSMHNDVQMKVFQSLLASRWMELNRYASGDLLARFSGDVATVAGCAVSWLPNVIIQLFTVLATLGVVLYYDPIMAVIALSSTPLLLLASRRLLRRQRTFQQKTREVSSGLSAFAAESFRSMDTLKSFGVEESVKKKLALWQEKYRKTMMDYNLFSIRTNAALTGMGAAVQYLALGYCLWRLFRGDILFGTMTLFLQQRANLSSACSSLISQIPTALSGSVAAERLRELTELPKEPRDLASGPAPVGSCRVEIRGLQVAYEDEREVLGNVDLYAGPGEVAALVGPSGEGKSTLIRLMLGLLPAQEGSLTLTDSQGTVFRLGADTRSCFAYVPQGNTILSGTIGENLRLVREDATEEEMIAALEDACAWEFVRAMPQGLHSRLGEGGKGISEGQAQRIAIARALLRKAPVMLLDEATSALDWETEQRVLRNLMNRGVTCITATHRPSVLRMCSRVYRVQGGRVTQLKDSELTQLLETDRQG